MVLDYKDIGREGAGRPRRRFLRILVVALAAAGLIVSGYAYRSRRLLRKAEELARKGDLAGARASMQTVASSWAGAGRALTGLASLAAMEGDENAARAYLARARSHRRRTLPLRADVVFRSCFARGDYELARDLGEFFWESGRTDVVDYYLGAAHLALGDLRNAQAVLARVSPVSEFGDRGNRLKERIKTLEQDPRRPYLLDRQRRPLALQKLGDIASIELLQPALQEVLLRPAEGWLASLPERSRRQTYVLAIDQDMELLADAALGKYEGSLVVMDPSTGEILAYATHPPPAPRTYLLDGIPSDGAFEPGSIVKVATYLAALDAGVAEGGLFPFTCEGSMAVDGKTFYDWRRHGTVKDIDEALAISCNLAFGRLGLAAGPERLLDTMRRFGFDHPPASPLHFGRIARDAAGTDWARCNASVGLEKLSATPIQVAMLAQSIANGGLAQRPILIKETLTADDERVFDARPEPLLGTEAASRVASPQAISRLVSAMRAVVDSEAGTGRRARVDGLALALKTGTAGERGKGLDALMIGFAPAEKPQLAFGLMAGRAGKAEYEGARIVKTFLESVIERGKLAGFAPVPKEGPGKMEPADSR